MKTYMISYTRIEASYGQKTDTIHLNLQQRKVQNVSISCKKK